MDEVATEEELGFPPYAKEGELLVIAENLVGAVMEAAKVKKWSSVFHCVKGLHLEGLKLKHPLAGFSDFFGHDIPLLAGEHVTEDAGTGFVHTAPAHGEDDFDVWVHSGHTTQQIDHP